MTEISSTIWSYFLNILNATENPTLDSLNDEVQNVDVVMILSTIIQNIFIYVFYLIVLFIPTAPDMFTRETCDEIKWCKSGGKFPLDIWV